MAHETGKDRQHQNVEDQIDPLRPGYAEIVIGQEGGLETEEQHDRQNAQAEPGQQRQEKGEEGTALRAGDELGEEIRVKLDTHGVGAE